MPQFDRRELGGTSIDADDATFAGCPGETATAVDPGRTDRSLPFLLYRQIGDGCGGTDLTAASALGQAGTDSRDQVGRKNGIQPVELHQRYKPAGRTCGHACPATDTSSDELPLDAGARRSDGNRPSPLLNPPSGCYADRNSSETGNHSDEPSAAVQVDWVGGKVGRRRDAFGIPPPVVRPGETNAATTANGLAPSTNDTLTGRSLVGRLPHRANGGAHAAIVAGC